jgi:hypothetical protein
MAATKEIPFYLSATFLNRTSLMGVRNTVEHRMAIRTRDWECACGHKWTAPIELSDSINQNIKGEKTVFCPKCSKKPLYGSQAKETNRWKTPVSEAEAKATKPA